MKDPNILTSIKSFGRSYAKPADSVDMAENMNPFILDPFAFCYRPT